MVYELGTYTLQPGTQPAFLANQGDVGNRIRGNNYGKLEGYWASEFGVLNQIFHLWSFPSLDERARLLGALGQVKEWTGEFLPKARSMILTQESSILSAAVPLDPPGEGTHVYELRRYTAFPGKSKEWLSLIKDALPARSKLSRVVGVWSSEIGALNQVIHMWSYRDLNERAEVRARAMNEPAWKAFASKAPQLIMRMESTILYPAAFSPMK
jgi:hypothetical protein